LTKKKKKEVRKNNTNKNHMNNVQKPYG
jgi:hypothetical protein